MNLVISQSLRRLIPVICFSLLVVGYSSVQLLAQQPAVFRLEFTDAQLVPGHWILQLHPDGSGQFDAEAGHPEGGDSREITAGDVHRSLQLSSALTEHVFAVAKQRNFFAFPCESHLKVAFQGLKKLSYAGPDGGGACEFNFSKDKEIEMLSNTLLAVETTILSGARMEKLLQHDRLGLDQELDNLIEQFHQGGAQEIDTIRDILTRIASDEQVMDRVRRKARLLLATNRQ